MSKRKICVFTGTRAEYGLLKPLMDEVKNDPDLELQILVSGMHLSPEFGLTYKEIEKDGFKIDEKVEMLLSSDTHIGTAKSIGVGILGFSDALSRLMPDIVVVLGDRFEALAFGISAYVLRIPIAHLYGGEATWGSYDEGFRNTLTKLSYLHFTSTEEYRKRVIQMGEHPEKVFNVGAIGIDNIKKMKLLSKQEIEERLNIKFKERNLLITFHPVTLDSGVSDKHFFELLKVLNELNDTLLIFTKANADAEGRKINHMIHKFVSENPHKAVAFTNLGQLLYLSIMRYVDGVVGNSSSGIIEAPSFKIGTVNIGDRQRGRIKAKSVIDCEPNYQDIKDAISKLYSDEFRNMLKDVINPYGDGNSAIRIKNILKNTEIKDIKKYFFDISFDV